MVLCLREASGRVRARTTVGWEQVVSGGGDTGTEGGGG